MKLEKLLPWAAVIAGAFVISKLFNIGKGASEVLTATGEAIGGKLYELFNPATEGETLFYTVKFPDGTFHAVASSFVDADGFFVNKNLAPQNPGDGKRYRIVIDKGATVGANKIAVYA